MPTEPAPDAPSAERAPVQWDRLVRRWRLLSILALTAGVLLLGLYVARRLTVSTPAPILPPVGEALAAQAPFRFAVLGDSKDNMSVFEEVLARVETDHPKLILHSGDIVKRNTAAQYAWVLSELSEQHLSVPLCVVPGNHDVNPHSVAAAVRYRLYESSFGPRQYWFACGNALFVAFDDAAETCEPQDLQWLDSTLGRLRDQYALCFVFMHVPPRDPRPDKSHSLKSGADQLAAILARHHVSAVFAGHIHGYLEDNLDGVPIYISGGAGADLTMPEAGYHYLLCSAEKDGTFQVQKVTVASAGAAYPDLPEYLLIARFPGELGVSLGAALLAVGVLLALIGRKLRRVAPPHA